MTELRTYDEWATSKGIRVKPRTIKLSKLRARLVNLGFNAELGTDDYGRARVIVTNFYARDYLIDEYCHVEEIPCQIALDILRNQAEELLDPER